MSPGSDRAVAIARRAARRGWARWLGVWLLAVGASRVAAEDRLELRDLTVIANRTVRGFDLDGVALDDGRIIAWDRIQHGQLRSVELAPRQREFDRFLQSVGEPLYRLRQRLKVGDIQGLGKLAAELAPQYRGRTSGSSYLVAQAMFWSHLASGRREAALIAHLESYRQLQTHPAAGLHDAC